MKARALRAVWSALALSLSPPGGVKAHAPSPRSVAVSADGAAVALSLPGFGLLVRAAPEQPFAYACDALLGLKPRDVAPALAFTRGAALLVASADGLRILDRSGCPREEVAGELATAPIAALALDPKRADVAYAVVAGSASGLWRSDDAGRHWTLRAQLVQSELTTGLSVSATDPARVYASVRSGEGATIWSWDDAAGELKEARQTSGLTLLSAQGAAPYTLWSVARDEEAVGNRGFAILRAAQPEGPWHKVLRVNYFGGLVGDLRGGLWVGDEIGGLYRSDDGGDSFRNLESDADIACLASAGGALWACTPGTPREPALQKIEANAPRTDVVRFADVSQLVSCPGVDVQARCAAAWSEWQRDVRAVSFPDAGVTTTGAALSDAAVDAAAPFEHSAPAEPNAGEKGEMPPASGSAPGESEPQASHVHCALSPSAPVAQVFPIAAWLWSGLAAAFRRRARSARARPHGSSAKQ